MQSKGKDTYKAGYWLTGYKLLAASDGGRTQRKQVTSSDQHHDITGIDKLCLGKNSGCLSVCLSPYLTLSLSLKVQ